VVCIASVSAVEKNRKCRVPFPAPIRLRAPFVRRSL
jgi:hypothetical protein